jgi:predicted transcriptional regulator
MTQPGLLDWQPPEGRAPYSNPTTSKEAAEAIEHQLARLELEVFETLRIRGPLACHEIEEITQLPHTTVSARIRGLFLKNRVKDTGMKRKTPSGRSAIVWCAV